MPTIKQKKAFAEITENHRSVKQAMLVAGYDEDTASKPKNLTASKGWKELMDEYLPDDLIAKRHLELLNKREVVKTFSHATGETEVELTDQPDTQAVSKALDMAYKLKGSYAAEKSVNLNITADVKNPKALELAQEYEEKLKQEISRT